MLFAHRPTPLFPRSTQNVAIPMYQPHRSGWSSHPHVLSSTTSAPSATAPATITVGQPSAAVWPAVYPSAFPAPPVPPGVNPRLWQTGQWHYNPAVSQVTAPQSRSVPVPFTHAPPSITGWNVHSGWGVPAQYYHPSVLQKKPEKQDSEYWNTQLTENGLMLENMHIK